MNLETDEEKVKNNNEKVKSKWWCWKKTFAWKEISGRRNKKSESFFLFCRKNEANLRYLHDLEIVTIYFWDKKNLTVSFYQPYYY